MPKIGSLEIFADNREKLVRKNVEAGFSECR
jgi:hypothetical protein